MTEPQPTPQTPPDAATPGSSDLLEWVVGQYLGQKIQAKNILNYNGANLAYNHARDTAQRLGLDPNRVAPFPQPTNITIDQSQNQPQHSQSSTSTPLWQKLAVGASLVAGGAGIVPLTQMAIDVMRPDPPAAVQPVEQSHNSTGNVGFEIR